MSVKVYNLHCEFCGQDFQTVYARKKWHDCEQALESQRKMKNEFTRNWRKQYRNKNGKRYEPKIKSINGGLKRCVTPGCINMTPNYFGRCDSCLSEFERNYAIDFIAMMV